MARARRGGKGTVSKPGDALTRFRNDFYELARAAPEDVPLQDTARVLHAVELLYSTGSADLLHELAKSARSLAGKPLPYTPAHAKRALEKHVRWILGAATRKRKPLPWPDAVIVLSVDVAGMIAEDFPELRQAKSPDLAGQIAGTLRKMAKRAGGPLEPDDAPRIVEAALEHAGADEGWAHQVAAQLRTKSRAKK